MTRVKICGITNRDDARAAIDSGADALGFIFVRNTPRYVGDISGVSELLDFVPPFVSRVGVCIDPDDITPNLRERLDVLQIYNHATSYKTSVSPRLVPAFRLKSAADLDLIEPILAAIAPKAIHLDTYHENSLGGTGITFDWSLAAEAQARFDMRIILAGGLTPENVAEAIRKVSPYGVDVSSGVEAKTLSPGRKDHARLKEFIRSARGAT